MNLAHYTASIRIENCKHASTILLVHMSHMDLHTLVTHTNTPICGFLIDLLKLIMMILTPILTRVGRRNEHTHTYSNRVRIIICAK